MCDGVHMPVCCYTSRARLRERLRVPLCMFNSRGVCIWVSALMASRCAARATEP